MLGTIEDRRSVMDKASTRVDGQLDADVALPRGSTVAESAPVSPNHVSPLPWRVHFRTFRGDQLDPSIYDAHNTELTSLYLSDGFDEPTSIPAVANAKYIVRACNSYPALVSVLRSYDAYMRISYSGPDSDALHPNAATQWRRTLDALTLAEATPHG